MEDLKISEEEGKIHNIFAEGTTFKALALREELVEACDKLGWATPTHIQAESIPHALEGRDMIGLAQTGSGKTGAFALPILHALLENPQPFFACVIAPIRELAAQISKHFEALGSIVGVKCATLMGGLSKMDETIALGKRPHIITLEFLTDNTEHANIGKPTIPSFNTLVATPGRLLDHLSNTKGFSLRTLKYLVLDEADKLLNADFEKVIKEILEEIPRDRKTYLFSATMTEKVGKLKRACLKNPVKVEASSKYSTNDTLKQEFLFIPAKYKDVYLVYLLNEMRENTSMIFTRTCESTRLLALILRNLGFRAIPLHGQMTEPKRLGALNKFKGSQCNILVCTDVGSRGLDMQVDLVINYDIPQNSKDYCHRVGRTARAGRSGMALSLVNQYEVEWFRHIENRIEKKLSIYPTDVAEVLLLADSVTDAKRKALTDIKENGGSRKRRRNGEEEDEEIDTDFAAGFKKKSKSFKKSTKSKRR